MCVCFTEMSFSVYAKRTIAALLSQCQWKFPRSLLKNPAGTGRVFVKTKEWQGRSLVTLIHVLDISS